MILEWKTIIMKQRYRYMGDNKPSHQVAPGRLILSPSGNKRVSSQGVKSAIYPSRLPGPQPRRREHKRTPLGLRS